MKSIINFAGTDSLGCAGVHQDLRASLAQNVHCSTVVTVVTAQNHDAFISMQTISPKIVMDQFEAILACKSPNGIKIGMMTDSELFSLLGKRLESLKIPVVYDPIHSTSSSETTLPADSRKKIIQDLLPHITMITPNIPELEWLLEMEISTRDSIKAAAKKLIQYGCQSVLIKGGHSQDEDATDYFYDGQQGIWLTSSRIDKNFRGTGCYLSTAIACAIANGYSIKDAVIQGKTHLMQAFEDSYPLGDRFILQEKTQAEKIPTLNSENFAQDSFPLMGSEPIGFYPVLPNYDWLKRIVPLGTKTVQIRVKDKTGNDLKKELEASISLCDEYGSRLFINDHWELAIELGAYGVHLGQEDLDTADILAIRNAGLRLGISTHSLEELERSLAFNPSYIALGPIFETTCKSMRFGPQGIDKAGEWVHRSPMPVVAIGGLKPDHIPDLLKQGVQGIALISDVTENPNPEMRAKEWISLIEGAQSL